MDRVTPMLWTAFGFALASAIYLPNSEGGAFGAFCAFIVFIWAVITEIHARRY